MLVKTFVFNPIAVNTYLIVHEQSKKCIIIDAGCLYDSEKADFADYIDKNGLTPVRLLNTHLHLDHCFGNRFIAERYGILPEAHKDDEELLAIMPYHAKLFGIPFNEEPQPLGGYLKEDDIIKLEDIELRVIHVPGHSRGGLAFYSEKDSVLFSGDSLFYESIGRTDLQGGDLDALLSALRNKIMTLPNNTKVYTGHGEPTYIAHEKMYNPYI